MSRQSDSLADARLVRRVLAGDEPAFDELVRRHRESVLSVTRGVLDDWDEAEDAAQEAFLEALRGLRGLRRGERFRAWLGTIARRSALRRVRRSLY